MQLWTEPLTEDHALQIWMTEEISRDLVDDSSAELDIQRIYTPEDLMLEVA